jgi:polyphosphate glucokinase
MPVLEQVLGLDIGGSGVKAAIVDVARGELASERARRKTPQPATPAAIAKTAARLQEKLEWRGPVGCGFPGLVKSGVVRAAPNLDPSWVGFRIVDGLADALGTADVAVLNDADAAGLAEMRFGAGRGKDGTVVVLTLGTGIGSAVFRDGRLLPYTEFGHLEMNGRDAEYWAAESGRKRHGWSWKEWAEQLDLYLARLEYYLGVDLFILGGGASKKADRFLPRLQRVGCEVRVAELGNLAGIVGAAMFAASEPAEDRA